MPTSFNNHCENGVHCKANAGAVLIGPIPVFTGLDFLMCPMTSRLRKARLPSMNGQTAKNGMLQHGGDVKECYVTGGDREDRHCPECASMRGPEEGVVGLGRGCGQRLFNGQSFGFAR